MDKFKVGDRVKAGRKHGTISKFASETLCVVDYDRGEWDYWLMEDLKPLQPKKQPAALQADAPAEPPPAGTGDGMPEISAGDYVIINPDVEGTEGYAKRAQEALAEGIVLASSFPIRNGRVLVEFDFPYGEFSVPAEWLMWVGNEFRSGENRNTRDQRPPIPYGTDLRLVDVPPEKAKYVSPKDAELAAARARIAVLEALVVEVARQ